MITNDFCTKLERRIQKALYEHPDKHIYSITTDGIVFDPSDISLSKKFVNDNRYAILRMYALIGGSAIYNLILLFGNKAASRYARGLDLLPYVPDLLNDSNMSVDLEKREIVVRLE